MIIGVPLERKDGEFRIALTPAGADAIVHDGHTVLVETGAGTASGFADSEFARRGAFIVSGAAEVWAESDLVEKVREPVPLEVSR